MSLHELVLSDEDRALLKRICRALEDIGTAALRPTVGGAGDPNRRQAAAEYALQFVTLVRRDPSGSLNNAHAVIDELWRQTGR